MLDTLCTIAEIFFIGIVPLGYLLFNVSVFVCAFLHGRARFHHPTFPKGPPEDLPGVSVIKPLMGVDPYLETNLESHFKLNYPKLELLMCVHNDDDPAINVVNRLKERHPKVNCRLFIGGKEGVLNPMVNNMAPAYDAATYDIVWISTSRIKASTEILLDMVGKLQNPKVALVHQMGYTTDQPGFAAAVEKVFFGTKFLRPWVGADFVGISCIVGMSYLVKKQELDKLNGLSWFGRFMSEDFHIAKHLHARGFRHVLASTPAQQNVANMTVKAYKDRLVRWMKLRLNMEPAVLLLVEMFAECMIIGLYLALSVHHFFGINPLHWFAMHCLVWLVADYHLLKMVQNGPPPFSKWRFLQAWLTRELLFFWIFAEGVIDPLHVTWGGMTFKQTNFGEIEKIVQDRRHKASRPIGP